MTIPSTFHWRGSADLWWHNKALDLRGAAAALSYAIKNEPSDAKALCDLPEEYPFGAALHETFLLISGLSIELLLKAILVLVSGGRFNAHHSHNLNLLASRIEPLKLTEEEKVTLNILSEAIIWQGKYPVPKNEEDYNHNSEIWEKAMHSTSSSYVGVFPIMTPNPAVWPSLENYNSLWSKINGLYWRLKSGDLA